MESVFAASEEESVLSADVQAYIKKFSNKLSENVKLVTMLALQYKIDSPEKVDQIVNATKAKLKGIASELALDVEILAGFQKELKAVKKKNELNQMPQMLGATKLAKLLKSGDDFDETTMDFSSPAGQNFIVKKYTPVLKLFVNKYDGVSSLDKEELWSIAYSALTYAMQTYNTDKKMSLPWALGNELKVTNKETEKELEDAEKEVSKSKGASFKTYLSRCLDWAIKYEMNRNSRVVYRPASEIKKNHDDDNDSANFDMSIDTAFADQDSGNADHYKFLGVDAEADQIPADVVGSQVWADFIAALKKHNSERDVTMFMKAWGIGGNEVMSKTDIAKMFNVSQPYVSKVIKKILTEIQSDKKYKSVLMALKDKFMENFGIQNFSKNAKEILEALKADDIYIMLENLEHDSSRASEIIYNNFCQSDFDAFSTIINDPSKIDESISANRNKYIKFLNHYDIFESHNSWSDTAICNALHKIFD